MIERRLAIVAHRLIKRTFNRASESRSGVHLVRSVVTTGSSCGSVLKIGKRRSEGPSAGY